MPFRNFGITELVIILLIVLVIFGAKKLPGLARSLGASTKEFRKGIEQGAGEPEDSQSDTSKTPET